MPDGVKIPVTVTGAEGAAEKLRAVGAAAGEARQAGQQGATAQEATAGGLGRIASAAGAAAEGQRILSRETRVMAAHLLGQINPALGSTFLLLNQIITGVRGVNAALLGLGAASLLIAGVGAAFAALRRQADEAREALERAREAGRRADETRAEQRARGAEQRARLAEAGRALGLAGEAALWQREINRRGREEGVPAEFAEQVVLARSLAGEQGIEFDERRYLAGLIAGAPRLGGGTAEAVASIRAAMERGTPLRTQEFARVYLEDVKRAVQQAAAPREEEFAGALDAVLQELGRDRPELGAKELELVRERAKLGGVPIREPARVPENEYLRPAPRAERISRDIERRYPELKEELRGTALTPLELAELANEVARRTREREGEAWQGHAWMPPEAVGARPIQITVNNYNTPTTNVASLYTLAPGGREAARAQELGGGEWVNE